VTADRKRKAPAAKSAGSKSAAKAPAKKTPAKKAPAKKTATKSPAANETDGAGETGRRQASAPRAESRPRKSATDVAKEALQQLTRLTGKTAEGVTGVERNGEGWRVTVEVLEVRRIPETTDVLARYEIETDDKGDLTGYKRAGRYTRGSARED
jgi:gas vesicle protein GvpO